MGRQPDPILRKALEKQLLEGTGRWLYPEDVKRVGICAPNPPVTSVV